jgi:hypothetical protein
MDICSILEVPRGKKVTGDENTVLQKLALLLEHDESEYNCAEERSRGVCIYEYRLRESLTDSTATLWSLNSNSNGHYTTAYIK